MFGHFSTLRIKGLKDISHRTPRPSCSVTMCLAGQHQFKVNNKGTTTTSMNKFKKMDDNCYESSFLVKIKLVMARLFEKSLSIF